MELIAALALLLGFSVLGNAALYLQMRRFRDQNAGALSTLHEEYAKELEKAKKAPAPTLTAEELIHDLTAGSAVVRIERLNAADLFLRRS
jgi:hypothetical protein